MPNFLKRPINIVAIFVVLVIALVFFMRGGGAPKYETAEAAKRDIAQEVAVTGRVQAAESLELAFEKAGRVSQVFSKVGDRVFPGSLLVSLDNAELFANLAEAEADVKVQESKLKELERGTRAEEIRVYEVKVANAEAALGDAKENVVNTLQGSYTKADDAVRNKAAQFFTLPWSSSSQLRFSLSDSQLKVEVESKRLLAENMLLSWSSSLAALTAEGNLATAIEQARQSLSAVKSFLEKSALALSIAVPEPGITQAAIDSWKTDVYTARTNVSTAITNVQTTEENLQTAQSNLSLAKENLTLAQAGSSSEEIAAQAAKLEQSRAAVEKIEAQIEKNKLFSPIAGVVTKQKAKAGELVSAGVAVVSLISDNDFEIETNVPEADIAKVKVENEAEVTLDAYGRDAVFGAKVVKIDPAETIIEGVATYNVTLLFIKEDERVKPGMTANINILTAKKEGVLAVPQRAVTRKGEESVVRVLLGKEIKEVKVKTGLRGSEGFIEITEGLKEGDVVITFLEGE